MAKPPRLSIGLLGPPLIEVGGHPLSVDTRKATALLAFLAVEDRAVRRETLVARFWPEAGPDRARGALRRTLSTLKSALDTDRLEIAGETVTLRTSGLELDIVAFRELVSRCLEHGHDARSVCHSCLAPLRAAVDLHRGQFLAGFGLRDAPDFDDWQQLVADELRRELAAALDRLATAEAAAGNGPGAIANARRRLALDPLHEPAHRHLMELFTNEGDRSAALEQYRECVRTLDRELGVAPLEETNRLYASIRDGEVEEAHPIRLTRAETEPRAPTNAYPLVGRAGERAAIEKTYVSVAPGGAVLVLEGEAGIGKTRLAEEFLAEVRDRGALAVSVRGYREETGLAYGLVIELLRGVLAQLPALADEPWWRGEVARLLPELGLPATEALDSEAAQARLYDAIVSVIDAAAAPGTSPGVLLFDDAHWADEASLGFLAYLLHRLRDRPLLVLATWRPEEVPPDHPVRRLLAGALRSGVGRLIELDRLRQPDVEALVTAIGLDASLAHRLYRESAGLPFFVVEYLAAIERSDDEEVLLELPGGVRDLLRGRLASLGELATQIVAAAAVIGRPFDPETVREASGRADDETVRALDELVQSGILVEGDAGTYDFRHEQARSLVQTEMGLARRRLLHRRLAEVLATRLPTGTADAVVAHHLAEAGLDEAASERYRAAGDAARGLYANAEALSHYRAALALGHGDGPALYAAIGDLETLAGDYGAAGRSYENALGRAMPTERPAIEHRIGRLHARRGAWEPADVALGEALAGIDESRPGERARILADRSLVADRIGRPDDARAHAEEALELATLSDDRRAAAQAQNVLGVLASRGVGDEPEEHLEASIGLSRAVGDRAVETAALNNLAQVLHAAGEIGPALELTQEALALCTSMGDRHREAAIRNNLADLLRAAGRRDEAMVELKHAVAIFAEIGEPGRLEPEIWKLSEW